MKEITSQDKLSMCCKAKTHETQGKYETKYYCSKCELPCNLFYADWEKEFFSKFCYEDGDGDEYDSWSGWIIEDEANPYEILKFINDLLNKRT